MPGGALHKGSTGIGFASNCVHADAMFPAALPESATMGGVGPTRFTTLDSGSEHCTPRPALPVTVLTGESGSIAEPSTSRIPSLALFWSLVPDIWTCERRLMISPAPLFELISASRRIMEVPSPANTPPVCVGLPFPLNVLTVLPEGAGSPTTTLDAVATRPPPGFPVMTLPPAMLAVAWNTPVPWPFCVTSFIVTVATDPNEIKIPVPVLLRTVLPPAAPRSVWPAAPLLPLTNTMPWRLLMTVLLTTLA